MKLTAMRSSIAMVKNGHNSLVVAPSGALAMEDEMKSVVPIGGV